MKHQQHKQILRQWYLPNGCYCSTCSCGWEGSLSISEELSNEEFLAHMDSVQGTSE